MILPNLRSWIFAYSLFSSENFMVLAPTFRIWHISSSFVQMVWGKGSRAYAAYGYPGGQALFVGKLCFPHSVVLAPLLEISPWQTYLFLESLNAIDLWSVLRPILHLLFVWFWFGLFFCMCMHVWYVCVMYICVCIICVWAYVCACISRPLLSMSSSMAHYFIYSGRISCWSQNSPILASLVCQPVTGIPCLCLPSARMTGVC